MDALIKMNDPRVVPALIQAMEEEKSEKGYLEDRFLGVTALEAYGNGQAQAYLLRLWREFGVFLAEKPEHVYHSWVQVQRLDVTLALYRLGLREPMEFVYEAAKSDQKVYRGNAAFTLGEICDERAIAALYDILENDPMDLPRVFAHSALCKCNDPDLEKTIERLTIENRWTITDIESCERLRELEQRGKQSCSPVSPAANRASPDEKMP